MSDDARCISRDPQTGKRCMLVPRHKGWHRSWRLRSQERPVWEEGLDRREWDVGLAGHRQDDGREQG